MKKVLYLLPVLLGLQCSLIPAGFRNEDWQAQLLYTVDKKGAFLYDLKTRKAKMVYSTDQVFLDQHTVFLNDSILVVGHQGESRKEEVKRVVYTGDTASMPNGTIYAVFDEHVYVTETCFAINLRTGLTYKFKTLDYEHIDHSILIITTTCFDHQGVEISKNDTTFTCSSISYGYGRIRFCEPRRFYSRSEAVDGKHVFSSRGNLYQTDQKDTSLLLKFDGHFDVKFGGGYSKPTLSPDGTRVSFEYSSGFNIILPSRSVMEMNIETKVRYELLTGSYSEPKYSANGRKILLGRNERRGENDTWVRSIYVFDVGSGRKTKIANGGHYLWKQK